VEDLARWDLALAAGAPIDADTQAQMYTTATLDNGEPINYGYGFGINDYRGHHSVNHSGHMHGVSTFIVRFLDDAVTIITLSNLDGFPVEKVSAKIAAHVLGLRQAEHPALTLDAGAVAKCTGTYVYNASFPFPAKVSPREGGLALQFDRPINLAPASESVFYEVGYPDFTVTFDEETNGRFTRLTMHAPFANDRSFYHESEA
jgi:CubicO group peptidase (beta-lactamase class C family)